MRFTAHGYAGLNEKLAPDLAVLEGGYAIETALPYVNTGIILAMAGLDYSWVREPDYRPEDFRESKEQMDYIKKLASYQWEVWKNREQLRAEKYPQDNGFLETNRHIFYDTDSIREQQQEKIKLCRDCPGYQVIRSRGIYPHGNSKLIEAVALHSRACTSCQDEARGRYQELKKDSKGVDVVYLQDKPRDRYFQCSGEEEVEITDEQQTAG
jgi:hypothetical protein